MAYIGTSLGIGVPFTECIMYIPATSIVLLISFFSFLLFFLAFVVVLACGGLHELHSLECTFNL